VGNQPERKRALTAAQPEEQFSTEGQYFSAALALVLAGGPDDGDHAEDQRAEREGLTDK